MGSGQSTSYITMPCCEILPAAKISCHLKASSIIQYYATYIPHDDAVINTYHTELVCKSLAITKIIDNNNR